MSRWRDCPCIANMHIEYFKQKTLRTAENSPRLWRRYLDDTFIVQQIEHRENFLKHINSINSMHQFYRRGHMLRWFHAILGHHNYTRIKQNLVHKNNRKPTHMDHYLHWDSHHHIEAKYSIRNTLHHRVKHLVPSQYYLELRRNT